MKINNNNYSVSELLEMLERRDLIVNRDYQRGPGLWPSGARSYFIDTMIEEFPFPKIYMYEFIERPSAKLRREIVDGQQRILTISDFVDGKLALSGDTRYAGCRFQDLEEEKQDNFLAYAVSVDVIRNAKRDEILQMFRRMNAYTLPLNAAEKRHSIFYGKFKWFINRLSDDLNEFFVEYAVFTNRQILRMADAELLTDCVLALERGVVSTNAKDLKAIYKKHDHEFPRADFVAQQIKDVFQYITNHFYELRGSYMMKPYALHSLVTAMIHARHEIPAVSAQVKINRNDKYCTDSGEAAARLLALAEAHEAKDDDGEYTQYLWGCSGGTNRAGRRLARVLAILHALGYENPTPIDNDLAKLLPG